MSQNNLSISKDVHFYTTLYFSSLDYNPVDFVYHSMGCKIQLMDQNDFMAQMILKYIRSYKEKGITLSGQNS